MKVVYDLLSGGQPAPIDLLYNGDLAVDSVTKRYKGSLVKMMDHDDVDHGKFFTFAGVATALENIAGILEEEQGITGNYLPDDGVYSVGYRKITPIFPSTVIEAEYSPKDAAGTANTDTGATCAAAAAAFTVTVTADTAIGGWVYMLTGASAGYLHYITDTGTTASATISPVANFAVVSGDTFLHIAPPCTNLLLLDATYTGLKSEINSAARTCPVTGLSTWIEAPGIGKTKLDFAKHAGLKIPGAKFYHHFTFSGQTNTTTAVGNNVWFQGILLTT
jgi:hypothetical protein